MRTYSKKYRDSKKYEWEKYALQTLGGTIAPEIVTFDDDKLEIIMTYIEVPKLELDVIYNEGDESIYKYAQARYKLEKTLDEKGIKYYDWKNEHLFYDRGNNRLFLIDYDAHETKSIPNLKRDKIENQFSFLSVKEYLTHPEFIKFKKKLHNERYLI